MLQQRACAHPSPLHRGSCPGRGTVQPCRLGNSDRPPAPIAARSRTAWLPNATLYRSSPRCSAGLRAVAPAPPQRPRGRAHPRGHRSSARKGRPPGPAGVPRRVQRPGWSGVARVVAPTRADGAERRHADRGVPGHTRLGSRSGWRAPRPRLGRRVTPNLPRLRPTARRHLAGRAPERRQSCVV